MQALRAERASQQQGKKKRKRTDEDDEASSAEEMSDSDDAVGVPFIMHSECIVRANAALSAMSLCTCTAAVACCVIPRCLRLVQSEFLVKFRSWAVSFRDAQQPQLD